VGNIFQYFFCDFWGGWAVKNLLQPLQDLFFAAVPISGGWPGLPMRFTIFAA
jgi:hypothetical protein